MIDPFEILRIELVQAAERVAGEPATPPRARSLWWRRPRPLAVLVAALVICGSATAAVLALGGSASQPLSGRVPGPPSSPPATAGLQAVAGDRYRITVFPELAAGGAGWETGMAFSHNGQLVSGGQAGGLYPTAADPIFGGTGVGYLPVGPQTSRSVAFSLTGPEVAAIRFDGRTIRTLSSPQLPTGDRVAVFFLPAGAPAPVVAGSFERISDGTIRVPAGPGRSWRRIRAAALVALDAAGRIIPVSAPRLDEFPPTRFWQAPTAVTPTISEPPYHGPTHPGRGACELGQSGLPGLTPEWGHTLTRIAPVPGAQGELLLSCIDTHYYLHGWPLTVAVLLNAQHPGAAPGPLPGATPAAGVSNNVDIPSERLSGRRAGNAWLVVSGGSGTTQRLRVLAALRIAQLKLRR